MRKAMLLRASLVPYIHSNARYAYDDGKHSVSECSINQVWFCGFAS